MLMLVLALTLCACGSSKTPASEAPASSSSAADTAKKPNVIKIGTLSMLNLPEKELANIFKARSLLLEQITKEGYSQSLIPEAVKASIDGTISHEIVYFDTLNSMVMALTSGDIDVIDTYSITAAYLCANNNTLVQAQSFQPINDNTSFFTRMAYTAIFGNDFAFMMTKDHEALRDEFNGAIQSIKADGTLNRLITEHITNVNKEGKITPVEMPVIEGAETITIAVPGSLPPMDYIAPNGTPVGFNTAFLAEISRRINKNIKLVQVDSTGRAAALASKKVDAAFWTRTCSRSNDLAKMTQEGKNADWEYLLKNMTEEERPVFTRARDIADLPEYGKQDMPEGTIITDTYYSDILVPVVLKSNVDKLRARMSGKQ